MKKHLPASVVINVLMVYGSTSGTLMQVIRDIFNVKNTMGVMLFNGKDDFLGRKVYVLEDVARPQGVKIPSETAIWEGDYWLTITYSEGLNVTCR